jgi:DNA replication protein DnaC
MKPLKNLIPSTANRIKTDPASFIPQTDEERRAALRRYLQGGGLPGDPPAGADLCALCGKPSICGGLGYVRRALPTDHPDFGKLFRCPNAPESIPEIERDRRRAASNLSIYADKTFETFDLNRPYLFQRHRSTLQSAYAIALRFAQNPQGWVVIEGTPGCGKTHLAAAIGNAALARGESVMFLTAPDLLDELRRSYQPDEEIGYDDTFEALRDIPLLILDDLGAENPSSWAAEKLFQLLNHRHIRRLPTVITTNASADDLMPRLRSRIYDRNLVTIVRMDAPDYRADHQEAWYHTFFDWERYRHLNFANFDVHTHSTPEELANLSAILARCQQYAAHPRGWLYIQGPHGVGKTHLCAAIANALYARDRDVIMTDVSALMDVLRSTFSKEIAVNLNTLLKTLSNIDLLILEDLVDAEASAWVREKLFRILDHRYVLDKPTIVTTALSFRELDKRILSRLLDHEKVDWLTISSRPYVLRRQNSHLDLGKL